MSTAIAIPASLLEFGGLKVSMQNALADTIDGVQSKRKVVSGTVRANTGAVTANAVYPVTGLAGTSLLLLQYEINAVTISSGTLSFITSRLLADGVNWQCICNHVITTTGLSIIQVHAEASTAPTAPAAYSEYGAAADTIYHGPWNDTVRLRVFGSAVYSVSFGAFFYAL